MPIDIAKTYFEIRRLRKEVQEAELALRISLARPPSRPRPTRRTNLRGAQATNPQMAILKRGRN
jgi:hypothetical protein